MYYFAKLQVGGTYIFKGKRFERGVELPVSEEEAKYLGSLTDKRLIAQGDKAAIIGVNLFQIREEEPTVEEKVLEEIKEAPDTLKPRRKREAD